MSTRHFHQTFAQIVGRPPGHELQRLRIERAKTLLADAGDKIESIAAQCGYENPNSFWVAFKRITGVSPKQYRTDIGER